MDIPQHVDSDENIVRSRSLDSVQCLLGFDNSIDTVYPLHVVDTVRSFVLEVSVPVS